jgi:hypothetical protein
MAWAGDGHDRGMSWLNGIGRYGEVNHHAHRRSCSGASLFFIVVLSSGSHRGQRAQVRHYPVAMQLAAASGAAQAPYLLRATQRAPASAGSHCRNSG